MLRSRSALRSASGSVAHRPPVEQQRAARRRVHAPEDVQQRGLPAAGGTANRQVLAAIDSQRHVDQRAHRPRGHRKRPGQTLRIDQRRDHETTSFLSVVAIGSVATSHIGYTAASTAVTREQGAVQRQGARLEDEEVEGGRNAGHGLENGVEPHRQAEAQRHGKRAATADEQHRLREHVGRHACARKTERTQRGDLREPLVDRHRQEHGHQQEAEEHRDGREHRRDLPEIREPRVLHARHDLLVRRRIQVGPAAPDGSHGRVRPVSLPRRNQQHVGLVAFVAARGRDAGARRRRRQLRGVVEGKVGDAADTEAHGRQGGAIRGAHRAQRDLVARRRLEAAGQRLADQQSRRHALRLRFEVLTGHDGPGPAATRIDAHQRQRQSDAPEPRRPRRRSSESAMTSATSGRAASSPAIAAACGSRGPPKRRGVGSHHANIESDTVEQIAERHDEPAREQQHVEQQRADRGNPENAERRPTGLAGEASGRERQGLHRRKHSPTEERPGRRDDGQDAERHRQHDGSQRDERRDSDEDQRGVVPPLEKPVDAALKRGAEQRSRRARPPPRSTTPSAST